MRIHSNRIGAFVAPAEKRPLMFLASFGTLVYLLRCHPNGGLAWLPEAFDKPRDGWLVQADLRIVLRRILVRDYCFTQTTV